MTESDKDLGMTFDIPANNLEPQGDELEAMRRVLANMGLNRALREKGYPLPTRTIHILGEIPVRGNQD